jgi:hypothetical protein
MQKFFIYLRNGKPCKSKKCKTCKGKGGVRRKKRRQKNGVPLYL